MQWEVEHGCFLQSSLFNKLILLFNWTERPLASSWPPYLTCVESQGSGLESQTLKKKGGTLRGREEVSCVCEGGRESKKKLKKISSLDTLHPLKWWCFAPRRLEKTIFLVQFAPTEEIKMQHHAVPGEIFHLLNAIFRHLLFLASLLSAVCQCGK